GGGGEWRRFALLSAWAWGAAVALTALCVAAHGNAQRLSDAGLYAPSLFETRTCFFEVVYTEHLRHGKVNKKDDLGAVIYFYVPMGLLVVVNAACLGLTTWNIRSLQKEASHVQRTGTSTAPAMRSAVLYVKLLLTAGVVELAVEGVAWGARSRRFHGSSEWAEDFAAQSAFVFAIVGTCIDVARAAAVLWLCVGRCRCGDVPGAQSVSAVFDWLRRGVSSLSLRRFSQPATACTAPPVPLVVLEDPSSSSSSSGAANDPLNSARTSTTTLAGSVQSLTTS
ncbi:Protein of unknown function, partial [Gryllus bimaculatus]